MGDNEIHIKFIEGVSDGFGLSQAIKEELKKQCGETIWASVQEKFEGEEKTKTWSEIWGLFKHEQEEDKSSFTHKGKEKSVGNWWRRLNMNVLTDFDDELVISNKTWQAILNKLGISTDEQTPANGGDSTVAGQKGEPQAAEKGKEEDTPPTDGSEDASTPSLKDEDSEILPDKNPPKNDEKIPENIEVPKSIKLKDEKKSPEDITPPIVELPEEAETLTEKIKQLSAQDTTKKTELVENSDGTKTQYANGYIKTVFDKNGRAVTEVTRDTDNSILGFDEYKYNEAGYEVSRIKRNQAGNVISGKYTEYDKKNRITKEIVLKPNGELEYFIEYSYSKNILKGIETVTKVKRDAEGKVISTTVQKRGKKGLKSETVYDKDGKVTEHTEREYKSNYIVYKKYNGDGSYAGGSRHNFISKECPTISRSIYYSSDGKVESYMDYEYDDKNVKLQKQIYRNPDGSVEYYNEILEDQTGTKRYIKRSPDGTALEQGEYEDEFLIS